MAQISQGYGVKWRGGGGVGGWRGGKKKSLLRIYFFYFTFLRVEQETSMAFIQNASFCSPLPPLWPKSWRTDRLLIKSGE